MIRQDRELLTELARLNTAMAPLAMRIMEGGASVAEQQDYAQRLIAAGRRLQRRVNETAGVVVEGAVLGNGPLAPPVSTIEPYREP